MFCSFPHRQRDRTKEASDSRQDMLEHENDHFVRDFLTFHASKSTFSYEFSCDPTSKSTFRARLPSIFITCHKMPRLPRNLHHVTTRATLTMRFAKNTQHDTSNVLRLPRKMTSEVSRVVLLPRILLWKFGKSIALATQNDLWHVRKVVEMSLSAMPATRNEATRRWKAPKVTPFAELTIGTAIATSRGHLRMVADGCGRLIANGCGRLRAVANGCGRLRNVWRTQLHPHTPRVKREPLRRIRE